MAGLDPAIHEMPLVDPRAKPGDDGLEAQPEPETRHYAADYPVFL
jgi:hypothetical protein